MLYILIVAIGYLLGNISSSYLMGKLNSNIDVRQYGSGNLGATNVFRVLGLKEGSIVVLGDALKGIVATLIGIWLKGEMGGLIGGMAAVVGHNWPFLLGFKGGKGIATSLGTIVILFPSLSLILFVAWILVFALSGYVSLASIISAALLPILVMIFKPSWGNIICTLLIGGLAIYRHKDNISRLLKGTEKKILKDRGGRLK
ncbi:MAG TPA: glycerol-3-phosphate 1-O-acyltransferase PlsY [Clostridia bacterium]|nr:glycerol-3-phosphate 1-O-acyltransferase PlsY [Clostridia bacterium]